MHVCTREPEVLISSPCTWVYGQAFFKGHWVWFYRVSSLSVSSYAYMLKAITKAIKWGMDQDRRQISQRRHRKYCELAHNTYLISWLSEMWLVCCEFWRKYVLVASRGPAHRLQTWGMCVYKVLYQQMCKNISWTCQPKMFFNPHVEWYARLSPDGLLMWLWVWAVLRMKGWRSFTALLRNTEQSMQYAPSGITFLKDL